MTAPTSLWLVRHGLVDPAFRFISYGAMDVPLCPVAQRENVGAYAWLARRLPRSATWLTSHLRRTQETARGIFAAGYPETPTRPDPDFGEQHLGVLHGLSHDEATRQLKQPMHPFWPISPYERPEGGESMADVLDRVRGALHRVSDAHGGGNVVVVCHAGVIKMALAHAIGAHPSDALHFAVEHLSLTKLRRHARAWEVCSANETP